MAEPDGNYCWAWQMIRKISAIYNVFSIVALFALIGYGWAMWAVLSLKGLFALSILALAIIVSNGILRKKTINTLNELNRVYAEHCDPLEFVSQYESYLKHCFVSKGEKIMNAIFIARMHTAGGEYDLAEKSLRALTGLYDQLSEYQQFWFLAGFIELALVKKESGRAKALLDEMSGLMNRMDRRIALALGADYQVTIMTFYAETGTKLSLARDSFRQLARRGLSVAGKVLINYELGHIAEEENESSTALRYYEEVIRDGNRLALVAKAKERSKAIIESLDTSTE